MSYALPRNPARIALAPALAAALLACGGGATPAPAEPQPAAVDAAGAPTGALAGDTYHAGGDTGDLTLTVAPAAPSPSPSEAGAASDEIQLELRADADGADCALRLTGTAVEKAGDLESRDDQRGHSHFVTEYVYERDDCHATVAIDIETKSLAWVAVFDCPARPASCPPLPPGPLTRADAGSP